MPYERAFPAGGNPPPGMGWVEVTGKAVDYRRTDFFADLDFAAGLDRDFFAAGFLAAVFLAVVFFAEVFLAVVFLVVFF